MLWDAPSGGEAAPPGPPSPLGCGAAAAVALAAAPAGSGEAVVAVGAASGDVALRLCRPGGGEVSAAPLLFTAHGGAVSGLALLEPEGAGEGARLLLTLGEENREVSPRRAGKPRLSREPSTAVAWSD